MIVGLCCDSLVHVASGAFLRFILMKPRVLLALATGFYMGVQLNLRVYEDSWGLRFLVIMMVSHVSG